MSSRWTISYAAKARKQLRRLDHAVSSRIVATLEDKLEKFVDPRAFGDALTGAWAGHWRYRVGDYRLIGQLDDGVLRILIVQVGHRRDVYR